MKRQRKKTTQEEVDDDVAAAAMHSSGSLIVVRGDQVKPRAIHWLWYQHLAREHITITTGLPDLGKSTLVLDLVARMTNGDAWPDGMSNKEGPLDVIILTAEDPLETVTTPRLWAAGADTKRVHFIKAIKTDNHDRTFIIEEDMVKIGNLIKEIETAGGKVGMVTADPITAFFGGKSDGNATLPMRHQFAQLARFAEDYKVAVLIITHPAKGMSQQKAIDQFIGSQVFIAAPRLGFLCVAEMKEADDDMVPTGNILFAAVKHNICKAAATLVYSIEGALVRDEEGEPIETTKAQWQGTKDITADQALAMNKKKSRQQKEWERAIDLIHSIFRPEMQDVPAKTMEDASAAAGISRKVLKNARERLGYTTVQKAGHQGWFWQRPAF